ncbi:hypothetical protein AVEN_29676-1 [Araneus ventricosus]|uniref:Uncharacterized protein n=1 Tax=Araneus ventricosus TaxID=182803 RepID=A0A4Y2Q764_ARAVE|nr:hypothetical protein AVEN_29676-1 [Araneus ventricosus]
MVWGKQPLMTYLDVDGSEIIKRFRNIVNCKQNDSPHVTGKKVEIANRLLDVLVFKCTQLTERALLYAEATLQQYEKNEQNTTFPQFQENVSHSDALSTQTFSTESPPPSHFKLKERGNTTRQNLIFAEALKKKRSPAILLNPKGTAENKTPVEEILKKELSEPDSNIQNIKKVQNKGLVVVCDKEEDIFNLPSIGPCTTRESSFTSNVAQSAKDFVTWLKTAKTSDPPVEAELAGTKPGDLGLPKSCASTAVITTIAMERNSKLVTKPQTTPVPATTLKQPTAEQGATNGFFFS